MSAAISEIGDSESVTSGDEVLQASEPERLEIEEMSGVLLGQPLVRGLCVQHARGNLVEDLFHPSGSSAETNGEAGILRDGEAELKSAVEPGRDLCHARFR